MIWITVNVPKHSACSLFASINATDLFSSGVIKISFHKASTVLIAERHQQVSPFLFVEGVLEASFDDFVVAG